MSKIDRRHALKHSVAAVGCAGAWLASGSLPATNLLHAEDGATPSLSPVVRENQHPGARDWQLTRVRLDARDGKRSPAIEGYCSKQSVAAGEQIEFMVSTTPPQRFRIEIFRTGYYGGRGARLMQELGPYEGTSQPMSEVGPKRLRECRWQPTTAFTIPADWLSGVYLARLTTLSDESGHGYWQSYAVFIVRDDRPADILLQCSDNTWQAYNQWPDNYSLYTHPDGNQGPWADVSFDRPYGKYPQIYENPQSIGSGEWLCFEFPMAYWLEQHGYDVSYCSNADMLNPSRGLKCKAFISNGHDEYWDIRQFESVVTMRDAGVNLLFLSGNSVCWVAPFRESSAGRANRIIFRGGPYGGDYKLAVAREKENGPFPHRGPDEGYLLGARNVDPVNGGGDWICALPEHWIFEGTGMQRGERIPGMIGWEYHGDPPQDIPGLEIVAEGTALQGGVNPQHWTATIYPGPKGNYVFNASTIWWCQGLANPPGHMLPWSHWSRPHGPDERIQRITHNLLGRAGAKPADKLASADGFVPIFDGLTLDGWEAAPSESATSWTVRDGMIVGVGYKRRSHLTYSRNKQIGNFELRFSYRLPGEGNTGVNIRAIPDPTKKRDFQSYHADIGHLGIGKEILGAWDFHTPGRTEHRCYRGDSLVIDRNDQPTITPIVNGLKDEHVRDRDWNEAHVIAQDNTFKLFINGKLASEFIEHVPFERRLLKGMLQLQLHDPGMIVHFKDVRLKVMD